MYGLRMLLVSIHLVASHRHCLPLACPAGSGLWPIPTSVFLLSISFNLTFYALGDQALKTGLKYAI
jgi:hypothetical protein